VSQQGVFPCGAGVEDVDEALAPDDVDPVPRVVEEIVRVAHARQGGELLAGVCVEHEQARGRAHAHEQPVVSLVEIHRVVSGEEPAQSDVVDDCASVSIDDQDLARAWDVDEDP
jgi:hypothetical protein